MIIVLLVTGVIAMLLATNKGYSALLGFALGFFLAIIGIFVVAFLPDRTPEPAPRRRTKPKAKVSAKAKSKIQPDTKREASSKRAVSKKSQR